MYLKKGTLARLTILTEKLFVNKLYIYIYIYFIKEKHKPVTLGL